MEQNPNKKTQDRRAWPAGVLTDAVIMKDVKRGTLPRAVIYSVAAAVLGAVAWPILTTATDLDLRTVAILAGAGFLLVLAIREWKGLLTKTEYTIREDVVASKEMKITYEDKDAELTGLSTRTPVLEFEKHGTYRLVADHFHPSYTDYELFHEIAEEEAVYMVYARQGERLLHIYRKKYWTLPEGK